jgi:hypothetical protein
MNPFINLIKILKITTITIITIITTITIKAITTRLTAILKPVLLIKGIRLYFTDDFSF